MKSSINIEDKSNVFDQLFQTDISNGILKKVLDLQSVFDDLRHLTRDREYYPYEERYILAYREVIAAQLEYRTSCERLAPVLYALLAVLDSMEVKIQDDEEARE